MKNDTMDNQQLSSFFDKGWLAGIIDGEGCLQLAKQKYRDRLHYRPQISISNCNPLVIEKIREICIRNGLSFYAITRLPKGKMKLTNYVVQIFGLRRCLKWIEFLDGNLVGKQKQLEIMKRFVAYRLSIEPSYKKGFRSFGQEDENFKSEMNRANSLYRTERLNDYTLDKSKNDLMV